MRLKYYEIATRRGLNGKLLEKITGKLGEIPEITIFFGNFLVKIASF